MSSRSCSILLYPSASRLLRYLLRTVQVKGCLLPYINSHISETRWLYHKRLVSQITMTKQSNHVKQKDSMKALDIDETAFKWIVQRFRTDTQKDQQLLDVDLRKHSADINGIVNPYLQPLIAAARNETRARARSSGKGVSESAAKANDWCDAVQDSTRTLFGQTKNGQRKTIDGRALRQPQLQQKIKQDGDEPESKAHLLGDSVATAPHNKSTFEGLRSVEFFVDFEGNGEDDLVVDVMVDAEKMQKDPDIRLYQTLSFQRFLQFLSDDYGVAGELLGRRIWVCSAKPDTKSTSLTENRFLAWVRAATALARDEWPRRFPVVFYISPQDQDASTYNPVPAHRRPPPTHDVATATPALSVESTAAAPSSPQKRKSQDVTPLPGKRQRTKKQAAQPRARRDGDGAGASRPRRPTNVPLKVKAGTDNTALRRSARNQQTDEVRSPQGEHDDNDGIVSQSVAKISIADRANTPRDDGGGGDDDESDGVLTEEPPLMSSLREETPESDDDIYAKRVRGHVDDKEDKEEEGAD